MRPHEKEIQGWNAFWKARGWTVRDPCFWHVEEVDGDFNRGVHWKCCPRL
jgi:hypothetical protein